VERESLLATLIFLLGGSALQLFAAWPGRTGRVSLSRQQERLQWFALWRPAMPALAVAAWLCGWALSQPDPVPDQVGWILFLAPAPFAIVVGRAVLRAAWALWQSPNDYGIATVGLLRPHVVFAPELAKALDERAIEAALAHERTHVRHRDPLRIWLAQFVTDLQWPWGSARRRFTNWLAALQCARDDEARAAGVEGADLAAAVLASLRFQRGTSLADAAVSGAPEGLAARVARLLQPLPDAPPQREPSPLLVAGSVLIALLAACVLGVACGERLIGPLLALSRSG
jgi:Zn-dependent protease with chaperone function